MSKVYVLEWVYTDGYDSGSGIISVYASKEVAEEAGRLFIEQQDDVDYWTKVTEYEVIA